MNEPMGPSPARQRNAPQTQHKTSKCGSATAEHFNTLFTPAATARGSNPEKRSIVPTPRPNPAPRADRRQRHKAIEKRRRDKAKDLLLQLQSLLVRCPRPCALSRRKPRDPPLSNQPHLVVFHNLSSSSHTRTSISLTPQPVHLPVLTLSPLSLLVSPSPSPSLVPSPRNVSLPSPGSLLIRLSLRSSASPAASVSTSLPPLTHVHSPSRGVTAWPRWAAYLFTQSKRDGSKFQWNMERLAESLYLPKLGYVP